MWKWFKSIWKTADDDVFVEYSAYMGGNVIAQDKLYHFIICYLGWNVLSLVFSFYAMIGIAIGVSLFWEIAIDYFHRSKKASWKDIIANGIGFICGIIT